ncbi:beta-lactamase family protein [Mucilaginibacter sp. BJC16-A38]|uniref:serine hydrolase domain-containing protein n=1 Tax=Mucilaginibacter phenanthrenivorans TaxID=1234842 RepID=UPI002157CC5D|nr:serine hydrolase [Mucilaginibacter phenanthrenivorans]MCR8561711.1 beta-lactamase family protein [Mucilaginibacter phenanthrenivorans]
MKNIKPLLTFLFCAIIGAGHAQINIDTAAVVKNNKQLYAIVVTQNDEVTYSHYYNGKSATDLFNNQSLTKSVMSLLIGIAIDKGYITSVDEKIINFFPQLAQDTDKRKQDITIRQIMNQASGLWHEDLGPHGNLGKYLSFADPSGYVLHAPLVSQPGKIFQYNNAASHLLSVILTKATGMNTFEFAYKYLFDPLEINEVKWGKMRDGYYDGCGLLSVQLRTADMNKLTSLLLHRGKLNGKYIVSEKWVNQLLRPIIYNGTNWGFPGSIYSLCFYHYDYEGQPITYALGWGGQYSFVIPGKNAVITVNERVDDATAIKAASVFLDKIFPLIYHQLH